MTRTRTRVLKDYYISLKDYNLSLSGPFRLRRKVLKLAPPVRVGSWEKGARRGRVFSLKSTKVVQNNLGKGPQGRVFAYGAPNAFHWLKFSSVGPEKCLHVHVHVHVVRKYFSTFVLSYEGTKVRKYFRKYENTSVQRTVLYVVVLPYMS
jgi:hypothetical protein